MQIPMEHKWPGNRRELENAAAPVDVLPDHLLQASGIRPRRLVCWISRFRRSRSERGLLFVKALDAGRGGAPDGGGKLVLARGAHGVRTAEVFQQVAHGLFADTRNAVQLGGQPLGIAADLAYHKPVAWTRTPEHVAGSAPDDAYVAASLPATTLQ